MRNFLTDLRYAWRSARRSPGVTLAIIAMLALGTGGVTAVFNPVYSTLFAPLPFPDPERLVLIGGDIPLFNHLFNRFEQEKLDRFFLNLTTYAPFPSYRISISNTGKIAEVYAVDVSEDFFETMGVIPLRGSSFKHSETPQAVVVSNRFWRNELMGADDVIGKLLQSGVMMLPIIGVMPESFDFPAGADIWMYRGGSGTLRSEARQFLGRLRPGMSMRQTAEELRAIEFKPGRGLRGNDGPLLQSLQTVLYGDRTPLLVMLGAAAVLFLLLVCAGVMNLLVTQGTRRKSEMALRLILGSTRRNLIFQMLRETLPLVVVGALAGLWISEIASSWLMAQFPTLKGGEVVVPVKMAFFAALVLAVTVIGGLTPALYASGVDLNTYLKSGDNVNRRIFSFSLHELLTGVQLGLTLALLTGVGLLISSMMFHVDIPIRWSSRDMASVEVQFPITSEDARPEAYTSRALYFQEFQQRLNAMPGVVSAGILRPLPFSADAVRASQNTASVYKTLPDGKTASAACIEGYANPQGFDMLGITLLAGRHFSQADMADEIAFKIRFWSNDTGTGVAGGAVIVNQSLARQFWPEENAVGKIIYDGFSNSHEIVGVVRDFHQVGDNKNIVPAVYYPPNLWQPVSQKFIVKLHSVALMKDLRQHISGLDMGSMTIETLPFSEIVSEATTDTRMTLQLLGCFALLGIVVAGLGVYATTSLLAKAWNREMGIRIAIGAQVWDILRLALWRGTRAILLGLPFGLFLAWILTRILSSYLFQVNVGDPLVWIISCAFLLFITIIAAFIPALRVTRVNPLDAMRSG